MSNFLSNKRALNKISTITVFKNILKGKKLENKLSVQKNSENEKVSALFPDNNFCKSKSVEYISQFY